ncbi:MAG: NAD-dependent epimerase/dehydratase family protein [Kofleriaceae bacterium]
MKVLLTGATTTLGVAVARALATAPDVESVLAIGREPSCELAELPHVDYQMLDLRRPRVLHDLIWGEARTRGIEVVVHAMQHRHSSDRGDPIHAQNVESTRELMVACATHPTIHRLVLRSFAEVYTLRHATSNLIDEDDPLDFDPAAPQWLRDRVEADLTACAHLGGSLEIAVLRCAEIFAEGTGSQLWDYVRSSVCLRPLGFDPMINLLGLADAVRAFELAIRSHATGVFNIPGATTLPLSLAIWESRRAGIPVPGPLLAPLYGLRRWVAGFDFRYDLNLRRFHFGGVLDGTRAARELGYAPAVPVDWPKPWWQLLFERLAA